MLWPLAGFSRITFARCAVFMMSDSTDTASRHVFGLSPRSISDDTNSSTSSQSIEAIRRPPNAGRTYSRSVFS